MPWTSEPVCGSPDIAADAKEVAMPVKHLQDFLDSHHVRYVTITHSPAYSAQMIAASTHTPGKEFAKAVIVKLDGKMAMAVLPACNLIDFERLKEVAGASRAELAHEEEFQDVFADCEVGAMPPFGNLYGLDVLVDEALTEDQEIAFNAGSHRELLRMAYRDFASLVKPKVARFSYRAP
jgi:Ala-tRNA(Pro) deacylase